MVIVRTLTETELSEKVESVDPLEELDLDLEAKTTAKQNTKIDASTTIQTPTDLSGLQMDIIQIITRQNYGKILSSISDDFYQLIADLQHKGVANERLVTNRLEKFIETRIERILQYSYAFQGNLMESLSIEEQDMYSKIKEAVSEFRNEIAKKINST